MLGCAPKKEIADDGPVPLHPTYYFTKRIVLGCAPKKEIADDGPVPLHPTYY